MSPEFERFAEEWNRHRRALFETDAMLREIATTRGFELLEDYHDAPGRDLLWVREGIHRKIQINPLDIHRKTFVLAMLAWKDRDSGRWLAKPQVRRDVSLSELRNVVEQSIIELDRVTQEDLRPPSGP